MPKLKEKVEEFAEIAKALPDNLQVVCFELLLKHFLDGGKQVRGEAKPPAGEEPPAPTQPRATAPVTPPGQAEAKQEDIKIGDLHVKAKKFLEKQALSIEQINNLFFKEDGQLKPLYDDLKTTRTSESQLRLTLLLALQNALTTGDFEVDIEAVRQECNTHKCYDANNFSNNYNNNKSLFDFDKYTKASKFVRLSEAGKKELANIIKELQ